MSYKHSLKDVKYIICIYELICHIYTRAGSELYMIIDDLIIRSLKSTNMITFKFILKSCTGVKDLSNYHSWFL